MGSRLFVGNLPYSCTQGDLEELFAPRWPVSNVRIVTDRETGRPRGFAFVELASDDDARAAIRELDGAQLHGRRVSIREAHERVPKTRARSDEGPAVEMVTRRSGFRGAPPRAQSGRRWEAPPDPLSGDLPEPPAPKKRRDSEWE